MTEANPIVVKPWTPHAGYRTETEDGETPIALQTPEETATSPPPSPFERIPKPPTSGTPLWTPNVPPPVTQPPVSPPPISSDPLPPVPPPSTTIIKPPPTPIFKETDKGTVITNLAEVRAYNRQYNDAVDALAPYKSGGSYDIQKIAQSDNATVKSAALLLFPDLTRQDLEDIKTGIQVSKVEQDKYDDWNSREPIDINLYIKLTPEERKNYNPIKPRDMKWYADEVQRLKGTGLTPEQVDWEMRHYYIKPTGVTPELPDIDWEVAEKKYGIYKDPKKSVNPFISASAQLMEFTEKSASTLRGYIANVPGPAPLQQVFKFAGGTAIGALVEAPLMLANLVVMAGAFGGEFSRGAFASGQPITKMAIPGAVAASVYAADVAKGMAQWFGGIPSRFTKDPAYTTGNLIGLFVVGPEAALKIARAAKINRLHPAYFDALRMPSNLTHFRFTAEKVPVGGWGTVPNLWKAIHEAIEVAVVKTAEAVESGKPIPKIKVNVEGSLFIEFRTPKLQEYLGPYLTHGTDRSHILLNEAYPNFLVGGKNAPGAVAYLSMTHSPRFAEMSGKGIKHKSPAFALVYTDKGLKHVKFTEKVIQDITERGGKAIEAEMFAPAGEVWVRQTPKEFLNGKVLPTYSKLRSRILGHRAGDLTVVENGKVYYQFQYKTSPELVPPKIGVPELASIHYASTRLALKDFIKDPLHRKQRKGLTIDFDTLNTIAAEIDRRATTETIQGRILPGDKIGKDGKFVDLAEGYWNPELGGYVRRTTRCTVVDSKGRILVVRDRVEPRGYYDSVGGAIHPLGKIQKGGGKGLPGTTPEAAIAIQIFDELGFWPKNVQMVAPYLGKANRHSINGVYEFVALMPDNAKINTMKNQPKGTKVPEIADYLWYDGSKSIRVSPHFHDVVRSHIQNDVIGNYLRNTLGKNPTVRYNANQFKVHRQAPKELKLNKNRHTDYNSSLSRINKKDKVSKDKISKDEFKLEEKYEKSVDNVTDRMLEELYKEDAVKYEQLYKKYPQRYEEIYQAYLRKGLNAYYERSKTYAPVNYRRGLSSVKEYEAITGLRREYRPTDTEYRQYDTPPRLDDYVPPTPYYYPRDSESDYYPVPRDEDRRITETGTKTSTIGTTPTIKATSIARIARDKDGSKAKRRFPMDSFAWKQGFGWWVSMPPYSGTIGKDMIFTRTKPAGVPIGRTPKETVTKLGINVPKGNIVDLGIMDVHLGNKGKTIKYTKDRRQKTKQGKVIGMPPGIVGARGR